MPLVPDPKNCDISVKRAIQGLSKKLGYTGNPTFANTYITNVITASTSVFSKTCTLAAGLNVLRVTGLQTDATALTGTLRGAYIDVSNGSVEATGTIRALELKARTEAPDDTGSKVNVLEGLSISADSKARDVTTMRAAEFILDGKTAGTIDEAVGLRIANNLQVDKATLSYGLQIYRDSFDYTYDISLSLGGHITGDSYVNQDLRIAASPQFAGLTITGNSVFGLNSSVFQPNTNSTTFFQVLDADGGTPIFNVDTTNERVGIGTISPYSGLHYQGDIFYLTPAAGPESNDNITIKNYATGNGAPDIILRTADIAGAYGIGVGTLSLIGGSKTTHYGGIGHGGGKISLQGGQGRDAANDPSYYAPVLLQPTSGNVGIGTTAPNAPLEVKGAKPGVVGSFQSGQLQVTGTGGEFYCAVITGHNSFNGNTQLWYLGSTSSSSHNDIAFINRQNAPIHFYTNNTSRMTIDAAGNVTLAIIAAEDSDVDKFLVSSSGVVKYRTGTQVLSDIGGQTQGDVLDDLNTLGAPASDGQFIVATGVSAFAYESSATARTSIGLGTTDEVIFATLVTSGNLATNATLYINERASAQEDIETYGQIWTKSDTPNTLWFTTDAGDDIQLTSGTSLNETSHTDVLIDGDFGSAGLMNTDGAGTYSIKAIGTDVQAYHANLAAIAAGTWTGATSITTLGTIATGTWEATDVAVAHGGTGASTAINARTNLGLGTTATPTFAGANIIKTVTANTDGINFTTLTINDTFGGTYAIGGAFTVKNTGNVGASNNLTGFRCVVEQAGSGTIASMRGATFQIRNTHASGVITEARTFNISSPVISSTGTIGTLYGLYIAAQAHAKVTTAYGIYQTGASDINYFGGINLLPNIKSGATQGAAGAAAGELWKTNGHASQEDNTVMIGV